MTACGFNPCFEKACKVDFTARCVTDAECRPTFISKTERILDECVGNKLVCFVIPHRWISGPVVTISLELEIGIRLPPPLLGGLPYNSDGSDCYGDRLAFFVQINRSSVPLRVYKLTTRGFPVPFRI